MDLEENQAENQSEDHFVAKLCSVTIESTQNYYWAQVIKSNLVPNSN